MRILGYLGPKGSNSYIAAERYCHNVDSSLSIKSCASIYELFESLKKKSCEKIIIPLENLTEGSVGNVLDLWLNYPESFINDALMLPISYNLYAPPKTRLEDIKHVISHPQCLAQCQTFIEHHCQSAERIPSTSSSAALAVYSKLKETSKEIAIIGSPKLLDDAQDASASSLVCIAEQIEDIADNQTRFGILENQWLKTPGHKHISLVFSTKANKPGSLNDILSVLSKEHINMSRIISRPTKTSFGTYVFFIDLEASFNAPSFQKLLDQIQKKCSYFRVLGSYSL